MSERNDPALGIFPGMEGDRSQWGNCGCWTCVQAQPSTRGGFFMPFIVCPDCGNKRCPKAMLHSHPCGDSNEPGQTGSRFADWTTPTQAHATTEPDGDAVADESGAGA